MDAAILDNLSTGTSNVQLVFQSIFCNLYRGHSPLFTLTIINATIFLFSLTEF